MFSFEFTGRVQNRLPSVTAGLSLALIVFIILTSQVGLYFWKRPIHSRHSLWIKVIIILIWMFQAVEVAASCHMAVVVHNNSGSILSMDLVHKSLWEWAVYLGTSAVTACLIHGFFISRIYLLETNAIHLRISVILFIILILEASFGFISMLYVIVSNIKRSRHITFWAVPLWLGTSILADISIAGSLCYVLTKNRPYLSVRMSLLVKRLVKFSIQTGLITSLVAGVTVAIWTASQLDTDHLFMCFPMGGIYATCFMANLLARNSYFYHTEGDENTMYTLEDMAFAPNVNLDKDESTFAVEN